MNWSLIFSRDGLTIIGAIYGLICGLLIGSKQVFAILYDSNYIDANDWKNSKENKLDPATRLNLGVAGGLFFTIGIIFVVLLFMGVGKGKDDSMAISTGALAFTVIGGLILYIAIVGKRAT